MPRKTIVAFITGECNHQQRGVSDML